MRSINSTKNTVKLMNNRKNMLNNKITSKNILFLKTFYFFEESTLVEICWKSINNSLHILRSGKEKERLLLGGGQL